MSIIAPRRDGHEVFPSQPPDGLPITLLSPSAIHIRPRYAWFHLEWREIWDQRELIGLFVRRDYLSKYRRTLLGPAWFFIQPVLMTLIFALVFGHITKIPGHGVPPFLFYFCGLLSWNYFSQTSTHIANTFLSNESLFGKVYFPRLIVPLAYLVSNAMSFAIQFLTFIAFWIVFKCIGSSLSVPSASFLELPLLGLHLVALSLGLGLCLSAFTTKFRDLSHALAFLFQLGMYATPIIYSLDQLPTRWRWVLELNPLSAIIEMSRHLLLGSACPDFSLVLFSALETAALLGLGLLLFTRAAYTFIDVI